MRKLVFIGMTFFSLVSTSHAASLQNCDFVQASTSNIKAVAASYGAKSVLIESNQSRSAADAVSFSFVDSQGQVYLGVNHVNHKTCVTDFYNVQKGLPIDVN